MLEEDRRRAGWSVGQAASRLGLSVRSTRSSRTDLSSPGTFPRRRRHNRSQGRLASSSVRKGDLAQIAEEASFGQRHRPALEPAGPNESPIVLDLVGLGLLCR
jgi:hypothetical protein